MLLVWFNVASLPIVTELSGWSIKLYKIVFVYLFILIWYWLFSSLFNIYSFRCLMCKFTSSWTIYLLLNLWVCINLYICTRPLTDSVTPISHSMVPLVSNTHVSTVVVYFNNMIIMKMLWFLVKIDLFSDGCQTEHGW